MADISRISGSGESPFRIGNTDRGSTPANAGRTEAPRRERQADSVSLSNAARSAAKTDATGEVRGELVARVRAQLDDGTYVTQEKLDDAVRSLVDDILRG